MERPRELLIVNRTPERARELAAEFSDLGAVEGGAYSLIGERQFDLVINGTGWVAMRVARFTYWIDQRGVDGVFNASAAATGDWPQDRVDFNRDTYAAIEDRLMAGMEGVSRA